MEHAISEIARGAARRLSSDLRPGLQTDVEAALHADPDAERPDQFVDPISLAGLIVSLATLAWTVYTDLHTEKPDPSPDTIRRTIRVKLRDSGTGPVDHDHLVEVVVDETIRTANQRP